MEPVRVRSAFPSSLRGTFLFFVIMAIFSNKGLAFARFTHWDASTELVGQWQEQNTETPGTRQKLTRFRTEERFKVRLRGFVLEPQVLRFSLGLGLGFSQEDLKQNGVNLGGNGRLKEYDLSATFFEKKSTRLLTFANKNENVVSRAFAPRTFVNNESLGASLRLDWLPLPSSLSFRHEKTDQSTSFEGQTTQWVRTGDKFFYQAGRSWSQSTLNLQYRYEDIKDLIRPSFSYRFQQGGLAYRLHFKNKKKNHLSTTAKYFKRNGPDALAFSNLYLSEKVRISLTERLNTSFGYIIDQDQFRDDALGINETTTAKTGFLDLSHKLYESLESRMDADVVTTTFPVGTERRYRLRPSLDYRKKILWKGHLTLGLNGRYEQVDRDAIGRNTAEEHEVTEIPLRFDLTLPVATLSNLTIFNPKKGLTLVENVDYIVTLAVDRATIEIIGTDPTRVATGDRLLVRYQFVTQDKMRFSTDVLGSRIGFDFSWISLSYQYEEQKQRTLSGETPSGLDNVTSDTTTLQFRYRPRLTSIFLLNEYRRYDSTRLRYKEWRFSQVVDSALSRDLRLNLRIVESITDYETPTRETQRINGRLSLTWKPGWGCTLSPFAGFRQIEDSVAPNDSIASLGLSSQVLWGKLNLKFFTQFEQGKRNGQKTEDLQVDFRLIRRF